MNMLSEYIKFKIETMRQKESKEFDYSSVMDLFRNIKTMLEMIEKNNINAKAVWDYTLFNLTYLKVFYPKGYYTLIFVSNDWGNRLKGSKNMEDFLKNFYELFNKGVEK